MLLTLLILACGSGTVHVTDKGSYSCEGEASFTITPSGELSGSASCLVADWGDQGLEGDLRGADTAGDVEGTWSVSMGWGDSFDYPVTGTVGDGASSLKGSEDIDRMGTVTIEMDTTRE